MPTLASILGTIEHCSAINFADHESVLLFDAQSEFFIPDLVNAQGDRLWHAINIDTGTLTKNVFYEGGQGLFYDSVLFFTNKTRDCTIVRLPEVGVAIQFAMHRDAMLAKESEASHRSQYQYYLDWRKDGGEANHPYSSFLNEWKALPSKFA
jgi:hypothetical protein